MALAVLWAGSWLWSVGQYVLTEPTGAGFSRGLNRVASFFGWQFAAGAVAVIIWLVGVPAARSPGYRWAARIPVILALVPLLLVAGVMAHALVMRWMDPVGPDPDPVPASTTTAPSVANPDT